MEEKTFEMIEKLYNRMEERFAAIEEKMATKDDLSKVEQNMTRIEQNLARMENKYDTKLSAVFDGLTANTEAIDSLRMEMKALEIKVDDHEVKLKIVK